MGIEIDLLKDYPKTNRNTRERAAQKTDEDRAIARKFGRDFFDGERRHGYGGFSYNERFWSPVVPAFRERYDLSSGMKILDVGCAKGFMLYDFLRLIPGIVVRGVDISEYAINNAHPSVRGFVSIGDAQCLPFDDAEFDLVISINTIHNLDKNLCMSALSEIQRVSKGASYVTVDAFRSEEEERRMWEWNLTAKTILGVDEWKTLFEQANFFGDYYWFIP